MAKDINVLETKKLYDEIDCIWCEDNVWYTYTYWCIYNFIQKHKTLIEVASKILNAGSSNNQYNLNGNVHNVDISDKLAGDLPNFYKASVESLPFNNDTFGACICVGSVLNYCNLLNTLTEIDRVLSLDGYFIFEYERTKSGEIIFTNEYNKPAIQKTYTFNEQNNHQLWLYSDKYVNDVLKNLGFEIIEDHFFHTISSVYNKIFDNENKAGAYVKYEKYLPKPLSKQIAHNRILLCKKIKII